MRVFAKPTSSEFAVFDRVRVQARVDEDLLRRRLADGAIAQDDRGGRKTSPSG